MPSTTIEGLGLRPYFRKLLVFALPALLSAAPSSDHGTFVLEGRLKPPPRFSLVAVSSAAVSFRAEAPVYWDGKFKFKNLSPGSYQIAVFVPRLGEFRQTYSVGPATCDEKGRVKITVLIHPSRASKLYTPKERFTVSAARLSISDKARGEYAEALKKLRKSDAEGAVRHLRKAVEFSPQFAAAWNTLGTVAYQRKQYDQAEAHFREAIRQDPSLYEPVVNLGGVLLNLERFQESLPFNQKAAEWRPKDALANVQLGTNYLALGKTSLALKHLKEAKRLDPGHFANPQLLLSEIYLRQGDAGAAAAEVENFLRYHPDTPQAGQLRALIRKLREQPAAARP
ncbi:MAG: tetratricopeptide repeat protein [Bryobacterales bacterium]|nr:tetratricopeptide repeat protein [Bryobacterales bacterium]